MALQDDLNRLQKQLGNFLFPRKCPFCGTVTGGRLLCGSCERTLPYTGENALRQGTFGRCASPLYYTGPVREAILRFKFQGRTGGLDCFGRLLADCAARWYPGEFDTVTWVPVSRKRLRQRGFDQSRLLAASLCVDWHVAPVETLRKAVDNPASRGLPMPSIAGPTCWESTRPCRRTSGTSVSCSSTISSPPAPPSPSASGCCGRPGPPTWCA